MAMTPQALVDALRRSRAFAVQDIQQGQTNDGVVDLEVQTRNLSATIWASPLGTALVMAEDLRFEDVQLEHVHDLLYKLAMDQTTSRVARSGVYVTVEVDEESYTAWRKRREGEQ